MYREYSTTFLGTSADDIQDFVTIRRRFDKPLDNRISIDEKNNLLSDYETEVKIEEKKYFNLINEKQIIEKEIEEIKQSKLINKMINQSETKFISFPYKSFLNLRHWHKAPKTLKRFFQALSCLFSISNEDFLTELKANHHLIENIQFVQPSPIVFDEFRLKYLNLTEISLEYIRTKSLDAYLIAIWMHNLEENERLNRLQQPEIENEKQFQNKLIQLDQNLLTKQKQIQLFEHKIKTLTININQILLRSN